MNYRNGQKRKRKLTKRKLIKCFKGSISITLCLLLTPFLTLALSLVEYSRYQEVKEITDEIYELTGISVLSDYDSYIHDRFGLLSISQENELGGEATSLLESNIDTLGQQLTLDTGTVAINGKHTLTNVETLRKQVVDFSELTTTSAIIAEDFKVEELLNKLQGVSQFQDIMNTVDGLAGTAEALDKAVTSLESLQTELTELQTSKNNAVSYANTLATDMADLYKKLGDNGVIVPENATAEQISSAVETLGNTYVEDLKGLYTTGNQLLGELESIKTNLGELKTAASDFIAAVNEAKQAAENISSQNSVDSDGNISQEATQTLTDVLGQMVDIAEDALADIKEDTINAAQSAVESVITDIIDSSGLTEITTRYSEIVNGEYFSMPLTDTAKEDLTEFLKLVGEVYSTQDTEQLVEYFKGKFVPQIDINVDNILALVEQAYTRASEQLADSLTRVIDLLTDLVNIVKGLFDLDLFYEADMNAYVNTGGASDSPYQDFLDALGGMFTAIDTLKESMQKDDAFSKLLSGLSAMKDMFSSMGQLMKSIWDIAGDSVKGIMELAESTVTGDVQGLYEKLLIAGYMRHNLPCRVDSGKYSSEEGEVSVDLIGNGLTGFEYNNIARPAVFSGQSTQGGGNFQSLQTFIDSLQNGHGSDTMFRGAELEYIRAGTNSEIANQVFTFFDIYFLRLLLDLPSVFMDAEVGAVATAATVASWVVYILYIIVEPFCDTLLLVNGENVPLIRTDCWLTATGVATFLGKIGQATMGDELYNSVNSYATTNATSSNAKNPDTDVSVSGTTGGSGLAETDYQAHVLIVLLAFVESDTMISRLQDLIELETAEYYRQNGKTFNMSKTYTTVEVEGDVTFNAFLDLGLLSSGNPLLPHMKIKKSVSY